MEKVTVKASTSAKRSEREVVKWFSWSLGKWYDWTSFCVVLVAISAWVVVDGERHYVTLAEPKLHHAVPSVELEPFVYVHGVEPRPELVRWRYLLSEETTYRAFAIRLSEYTGIREFVFMGHTLLIHRELRVPLGCVEKDIRRQCGNEYRPKSISGWRPVNTFVNHPNRKRQEYSNHIFGLAIDIDPELNPCCECVDHWKDNPRCLVENGAIETDGLIMGRYDIPECWIAAFKANGFYWLGDDALRDTMHFEFLAAPGSVSCNDSNSAAR